MKFITEPAGEIQVTPELAYAIVDMDNIAFVEGLGPMTGECQVAWDELIAVIEEVTGRKSHQTEYRESRGQPLGEPK